MQIEDWIVHDIPEHIIATASDWIVQLDKLEQGDNPTLLSAGAEQKLRQQFYDWLNQDQLHQLAFLQLSEIWAKTSMLKHMEHLMIKSEVIPFPGRGINLPAGAEHSPILLEHSDALSAPAWMYFVAIGLVVTSFFAPLLF